MSDENRPEIRVERATDAAKYLASDLLVWFAHGGVESHEIELRGVPEDQRFVAEVVGAEADPATYPGIYGVRPMHVSVPDGHGAGRPVPVAGLTWVGVHPDHRRKGLLTEMLRHHVEQTRREGGHLSALHASEPGIYGRHGYGLASLELEVELGRGTAFVAPYLEDEAGSISTHLATVDDAGMAARRRAIDLALLGTNVGTIVGNEEFYADLSHVSADHLRELEPPRILVAVQAGRDVGYAVFTRKHHWPNARPSAKVQVSSLSGGPAARLALLRRVTDLDLSGTVTVEQIGAGDPLLSWVQGPRGLGDVRQYDSLWVRVVDLPQALAARRYEADCDVVVEVSDAQAPWNAGRWRIRVAGGACEATRSDDDPELSLPVSALGAAYLGGTNLAAMARAGTVAEHRPGAVVELWNAFRTSLTPYAARGF